MNWDEHEHFEEREFTCHCGCGRTEMDGDFIAVLSKLRVEINMPFEINSGYRCPEYDKSIGGAGVHPTGKAADISVPSQRFMAAIMSHYVFHNNNQRMLRHPRPIRGVGINMKGDYEQRFVHLDTHLRDGVDPGTVDPYIWGY